MLDLVLCSLHGDARAEVTPQIADHKGIMVKIDLPRPQSTEVERTVWDFKHAAWDALASDLACSNHLPSTPDPKNSDVDAAAASFIDNILRLSRQHIPTRTLREYKGTHPWLDDDCRDAILAKHKRDGQDDYTDACQRCTDVLSRHFALHIQKIRDEMRALPRGSKKWWRLSKQLMDCASHRSGIPSLRAASGEWVHKGKEKADLFADALTAKFALPEQVVDDTSLDTPPAQKMTSFVLIRERGVRREL